jgi:hypothetical protein
MLARNAALAKLSLPSCAKAWGSIQNQPIAREDAPDPPIVEPDQAETADFEFARDDAGDQKTRNHEEHIDADEAAGRRIGERVEVQHQQHGDGAEAVDIRPIFR